MVVIIFPDFQIQRVSKNINLLLTEHEGRTGEYWPEVDIIFPRISQFTSVNCNYSLLPTDDVRAQISEHNFLPNGGYLLLSILCFVIRSRLLFDWLFEERSLDISATRIRKVRDPSLDMEVHGEQPAVMLPMCSVAPYPLQTLHFFVLTSVLMKIGLWAKTISLILFHLTTWSGL